MTTTRGTLLVTCVGGFACTEWELHNRPNRERVFGSAQQFEMRIDFMNLVMEQLQSMWWKMVRWLCFFSSRAASVILTHYIIAVALTIQPQPWDSQLCLRLAVGQWAEQKQKCLWYVPVLLIKASWHPLTDPKPPVFLPEGENPAISCGEAPWLRWAKHHVALQIFPVALTCFVSLHNRDAGWWLIQKGLIHENLSGL